jgi:hypothetical protein
MLKRYSINGDYAADPSGDWTPHDAAAQEIAAEKASKDTAYSERDRLVCAISKVFPSHLERHPDADTTWEDDWRWIVFVQFPTGQASWHIHDSELGWFDHLERCDGNSWDGHSTAEKYARIERFEKIGELKSAAEEMRRLREALSSLLALAEAEGWQGLPINNARAALALAADTEGVQL